MIERPILLDITRLIARSWTRRRSTGIDRVSYAYLDHFGPNAHAVVQHRGVFQILTARHSDTLFSLLRGPDAEFRARMIGFTPRALASGRRLMDCEGAIYLNVGHTDFDLASHTRWARACRLRPVYLIHDLIPLTHSEFCSPHGVRRHRARVTNALAHAAGIIANSEASRLELERFARAEGLRVAPMAAAWLGGARLERPGAIPFSAQPHFVCVGTIEARKNHYLLLQIWRRLVERLGDAAPQLVIIGQKGVQAGHVEAMLERCPIIQGHVITRHHCSDEELARWVGTARALLMPSFAEGFGLPVIEALQLGTPVIASDLPCFREIGEGIPTLLDPLDAISWEQAIMSFLENGQDRSRQLQLLRNYRAPGWKEHFDRIEPWLEALPQADTDLVKPAFPRAGAKSARVAAGRLRL